MGVLFQKAHALDLHNAIPTFSKHVLVPENLQVAIYSTLQHTYLPTHRYSTAQLQGNIQTRLKRVQDASGTHARRVHASTKPRDKAATRHT